MPKTLLSLPARSGAESRRRQRGVVSSSLVVISLYHAVMLRRSALAWVHGVSQRGLNLNNVCRNRHAMGQRTIAIVKAFELAPVQHRSPRLSFRWFASQADDQTGDEESPKKKGKKKYRVRDDIGQKQLDKLAEAFDELAKKEGFDSSLAYFADDKTFEDEFLDEDYLDFDEKVDVKIGDGGGGKDDILLDSSEFGLGNFDEGAIQRDKDGPLFDDDDDEMDARIAAAKRDMDMGQVSVPGELDHFAGEISPADLRKLGFRQEVNPFGNDETPRKEQFKLITNSMICSACGADFQCHSDQKPGYLPPEKFDIQVKLNKIEEMQRLQEKPSDEWTAEDEVEWLIQKGDKEKSAELAVDDITVDTLAEQMGLDLVELSKKKIICKRCHGLQNFGKVDNVLRPGWTKEPLLSQEKFRDLLRPISEKPAVIVALIDLFDFAGSVLPELDNIAGDNPVILAANKADLLPSKMGKQRAENWVRRELEYLGVRSLANVGGAVRLISCKTGAGVGAMLEKARALAEEMDCDIYVVGAANAGKSTLMNYVLSRSSGDRRGENFQKRRAGNANAWKDALTTSPLPGTTLKFIKVELNGGRSLYDTPGLLVPGTITQILTPEELKIVVPKKQIEPITFRIASGKCMLIGGLARIELIGDSKPFLFTAFVANEIKLHLTDAEKADTFIKKHTGEMLTPPLPPGEKRLEQIGEFEDHIVDIEGNGWKEAAADISLTGLGWVAVTGAGKAKVRISVPKGIGVSVRPPLMPFDIWEATAKYTGSRAYRKTKRSSTGKRRKGVARR